MATASRVRCIVVVADVHAGSTKGLLPPGFKTLEDVGVKQNPMQEFLWDCWTEFGVRVRRHLGNDPYSLVCNGDMIEGVHHGTKEIISPDVADHIRAAVQVLTPLAQSARKTFMVMGTECHVGRSELGIGEALKAEINPESPAGNRAFQRLTLNMAGVRCVFRHHISASVRRQLSATQLSIALGEEQLEAANNCEEIPRVVCAAHRHRFGHFEDDHGLCVVSPPWQFLTAHGHKVVSPARTKPGGYILDWRNRNDGELPDVKKILFSCPEPQAITL